MTVLAAVSQVGGRSPMSRSYVMFRLCITVLQTTQTYRPKITTILFGHVSVGQEFKQYWAGCEPGLVLSCFQLLTWLGWKMQESFIHKYGTLVPLQSGLFPYATLGFPRANQMSYMVFGFQWKPSRCVKTEVTSPSRPSPGSYTSSLPLCSVGQSSPELS